MSSLTVNYLGIPMASPVIGASGTVGYGLELNDYIDMKKIGALSGKGLAPTPWKGNEGVRVAETTSGMLNCIGLENPGAPWFIQHYLPEVRKLPTVFIANMVGKSVEEYAECARMLTVPGISALEVNISCPNVKEGGAAFFDVGAGNVHFQGGNAGDGEHSGAFGVFFHALSHHVGDEDGRKFPDFRQVVLDEPGSAGVFKADAVQHARGSFGHPDAFVSFPGGRRQAFAGEGADFFHIDVVIQFQAIAYGAGGADDGAGHGDAQIVYCKAAHKTTSSALNTGPSAQTL